MFVVFIKNLSLTGLLSRLRRERFPAPPLIANNLYYLVQHCVTLKANKTHFFHIVTEPHIKIG